MPMCWRPNRNSTSANSTSSSPLKFYRAIARWSDRFLAAEGKGLTEINEVLGKETEAVFKEAGFAQTDIVKDFYDKNRFIFYTK